ncbi:hypothetical protein ES703_20902 [subsurface metagenome]
MTMATDRETTEAALKIEAIVNSAIDAAEILRGKILAKEVDPRSGLQGEPEPGFFVDIYALKDNHYLACFYQLDLLLPAIFSNRRILKCVDALLLKYDRHHARWSVEAFSFTDPKEKFRQKIIKYRPDWLDGSGSVTPVAFLAVKKSPTAGGADGLNAITR